MIKKVIYSSGVIKYNKHIVSINANEIKVSVVVRVFGHDAMGRRIDPSWWTH